MKQCPRCRTSYTDDSLRFCLADGAVLEEAGEQETAVRRVSVDVGPPPTVAIPQARATSQTAAKGGRTVLKIVIGVMVLGLLALVAAGGAGLLYYMNSGGTANVAQTTPTPRSSPSATPTPTPDPETERLEKELANVLKKLEDELKSEANRSGKPAATDDVADGQPTARVNSPNDGFLALRDAPDAETGTRLAKIPHGAVVTLENCEKERTTIAGRTGRWCMVTYDGETGWVFDAWLEY